MIRGIKSIDIAIDSILTPKDPEFAYYPMFGYKSKLEIDPSGFTELQLAELIVFICWSNRAFNLKITDCDGIKDLIETQNGPGLNFIIF